MRLIMFLLLLLISSSILSLTAYPKQLICNEKEKRALLNFKAGLKDSSNRLSSWSENGGDCCQWMGVRCNSSTGQVTGLLLSNPCAADQNCYEMSFLGGNVTSSLLELEFLSHLDLSQNNFDGSSIPAFLGSMGSLTYLNFSDANFAGMIPHQLGNFSSIRYLDLGGNYGLYTHDLSWMVGFHSLKYLNLSSVNLQNATNWYQAVSMLPSLQVLELSYNNLNCSIPCEIGQLKHLEILSLKSNSLRGPIPKCLRNLSFLRKLDLSFNKLSGPIHQFLENLSFLRELDLSLNELSGHIPQCLRNLSFLRKLDLSINYLSGPIPQLLGNLSFLRELHLSYNQLSGHIPQLLGNLSFMEKSDLSHNQLSGHIPRLLGNLSLLRELYLSYNQLSGPIPQILENLYSLSIFDLSHNQLNGTIPKSVGFLSNLQSLDIGYNSLSGNISEAHLAKLQKLEYLDISHNFLYFQIDPNWIPPFQLETLLASHCLIGPKFPIWLQTQTSLVSLYISYSGISEIAPDWLCDFSSHLDTVDYRGNQIFGDISNIFLNARFIYLDSNKFFGHMPRLSPNVEGVYLANNFLSGEISTFFCRKEHRENNLWILDLSNNSFLGGLPNECLVYWQSLISLKLGKNNLSGYIPDSMSFLSQLQSLQLQNNNLQGNMPLSLKNCTNLVLLNFAKNRMNGVVPYWIGELTNLEALILRSNNFSGKIPLQIWKLSELKILDLANNCLSGPLPTNISLPAMRNPSTDQSRIYVTKNLTSSGVVYDESLELSINKRDSEYEEILGLVRSIDLSSNNLTGLIPPKISSLVELLFLNLSNNQFKGNIPDQLGGMTNLIALDLSKNRLSGEIPQSFSSLTFLNELNVSYNNLSGRIPSGTQLQGFNESSYIGNEGLCGTPLLKSCTIEREIPEIPTPTDKEADDRFETSWFYIGMGCGFVVAYLGVWSVLFFKKTWRHAYFRFVEDMKDKIYVTTLVKTKQLRRMLKRSKGN